MGSFCCGFFGLLDCDFAIVDLPHLIYLLTFSLVQINLKVGGFSFPTTIFFERNDGKEIKFLDRNETCLAFKDSY
jgi:hypothetical protein